MSDFLQFVDRVPTLPNRKKITHADSSVEYATVEYADEPVATGTPLNRANFNKLNSILGYNKITAEYNESTNRVEFTADMQIENFKDKQFYYGELINDYDIPTIGINTIKPMTLIGNGGYKSQFIKLTNGNIFIIGANPSSSWNGCISIIDSNGNTIKNTTEIGAIYNFPQLIEMSNGNIMVAGGTDSGIGTYIAIFDNQGNTIKATTDISNGYYIRYQKLLEMSNGNILLVGNRESSSYSYEGYAIILDKQGNRIGNVVNIGAGKSRVSIIEMSDGNILAVGYYPNDGIYGTIFSQTGTIVKSAWKISSSGSGNPQLIEMSNGNIMIVSHNTSSPYAGYAIVINKSGTTIKSSTLIGNYMYYPQLIEMSNGNIMIVGADSSTDTGYAYIVDKNINIIKGVNLSGGLYPPKLINLSDGNIAITGSSSSGYGNLIILDENANTLASAGLGRYFSEPELTELPDKSILVLGNRDDTNYPLYFYIGKPFLTINPPVLNGKPIDKYLLKNNKYKIVYDLYNDKFYNENQITLFDITLTEAVNQVDLNGISDMLEDGKLYELLVFGTSTTTSEGFKFGDATVGYMDNSFDRNSITLFTYNKYDSTHYSCRFIGTTNSTAITASITNIFNSENIRLNTASNKFKAGTRIIIKEVA